MEGGRSQERGLEGPKYWDRLVCGVFWSGAGRGWGGWGLEREDRPPACVSPPQMAPSSGPPQQQPPVAQQPPAQGPPAQGSEAQLISFD